MPARPRPQPASRPGQAHRLSAVCDAVRLNRFHLRRAIDLVVSNNRLGTGRTEPDACWIQLFARLSRLESAIDFAFVDHKPALRASLLWTFCLPWTTSSAPPVPAGFARTSRPGEVRIAWLVERVGTASAATAARLWMFLGATLTLAFRFLHDRCGLAARTPHSHLSICEHCLLCDCQRLK